jgi:RNA polymerase sigma-70 factor (ECF subfamily)
MSLRCRNDRNNGQWAAARAGDQDAFQHLTDPYRHELLVHCYRMLGSLEDAEDALQEILLRAWRRLDSVQAQSALRAWLYKIGTNVSLDMLDSRKRRIMPTEAYNPADPDDSLPGAIAEPIWLEPLPDTYLDGYVVNPEARYEAYESVSLAFLTALQHLPGRQRAILILRDVMGWSAQDVANLLDLTVIAVNSALQRARSTLKSANLNATKRAAHDENIRTLLSRYVKAWEAADSAQLISLLQEDAILTMPPIPAWYRGGATVAAFLKKHVFQAEGAFRLTAIRANGCPAFALYMRDENGIYRPGAIHVLSIEANQISRIDDFLTFDSALFSRFNLPLTI